jgi:hypothetical protein
MPSPKWGIEPSRHFDGLEVLVLVPKRPSREGVPRKAGRREAEMAQEQACSPLPVFASSCVLSLLLLLPGMVY